MDSMGAIFSFSRNKSELILILNDNLIDSIQGPTSMLMGAAMKAITRMTRKKEKVKGKMENGFDGSHFFFQQKRKRTHFNS